ncbi:MAG: VWA domain-containing protein [Acidobacteriota bacterium]|nr:VWA domain-containing protein [Acidobacteriota bacterium]
MSGRADLAAVATAFARTLRGVGLDAPPSATLDFAAALALVGVGRPDAVYWAGRACFCRGPEDADPYARAFAAFFTPRALSLGRGRLTTVPPTPAASPALAPGDDAATALEEPRRAAREAIVAYSPAESLRTKDFAACTDEELAEAGRVMSRLRRRPALRRSRRLVASRGADQGPIDLRRTLRDALSHGGDPSRLSRRVRATRARRVVLLLDVSGSMRPYARALLRFAHATIVAQRRAEAFTLGTRCTRVTRQLSWRDPDAALARVASAAPDLEGGTRLGACLREFNESWGLGGLARGAVVVLSSDGWDRGDPALLATEMARLSRVAHSVVWVNPLKASEGYEPLVRGMAAALPYTDDFVAGNSLEALEELAEVIAR